MKQKNELFDSLMWIVLYVGGCSYFDQMAPTKLYTLLFQMVLVMALLLSIQKKQLFKKYGLCLPEIKVNYLPLLLLSTCNLWGNVTFSEFNREVVFGVLSMCCVGFLEEVIFRGLLFQGMCQDDRQLAMVISSVTFGLGHIVNLFNGSGMGLINNLCQVVSAISIGYLFVILFVQTKSLLPCIFSHIFINTSSVLLNGGNSGLWVSAVVCGLAIGYALYLQKKANEN